MRRLLFACVPTRAAFAFYALCALKCYGIHYVFPLITIVLFSHPISRGAGNASFVTLATARLSHKIEQAKMVGKLPLHSPLAAHSIGTAVQSVKSEVCLCDAFKIE